MSERYLAAVEISSSKIIAAVGKTNGDGALDVIAVEQENVSEAVRYGIIQNLEETSQAVGRVLTRLEQRSGVSPRKIKSVIVGLGGRSLRNITTEVSVTLPEETEVTDEILERLRSQAFSTAIDSSLEVVDAVPRIYRVGKTETNSPKGMVGNSIHAVFELIVCRPELKRNIRRTIADKLHLKVEAFVVTAMATGHLILSSEEKNLGCMLADLGSETTTVTIYKRDALRYLATIPMGGRNITRDVTSLGVPEARAEEIKRTSGNALSDNESSTLNIGGLRLSDVSNLIVARSEEIVANIIEQISYAGLKETDLQRGIVCIGGGWRLQGMTELLAKESDLTVRKGTLPDYVKLRDTKSQNAEFVGVASVLYAGATLSDSECLEMPLREELHVNGELQFDEPDRQEPELPEKPKGSSLMESIRKKFTDRITNLFGNTDDDSELIE